MVDRSFLRWQPVCSDCKAELYQHFMKETIITSCCKLSISCRPVYQQQQSNVWQALTIQYPFCCVSDKKPWFVNASFRNILPVKVPRHTFLTPTGKKKDFCSLLLETACSIHIMYNKSNESPKLEQGCHSRAEVWGACHCRLSGVCVWLMVKQGNTYHKGLGL